MPDNPSNGFTNRESMELADIIEEIECNRRKITELIERNEELEQRKAEIEFALEIRHAEKAEKIAATKFDGTFPWSDEVDTILKKVFRLSSFRPLQKEVINAIMSNLDTLVVMSTGAGKSLCYQLPAVAMKENKVSAHLKFLKVMNNIIVDGVDILDNHKQKYKTSDL
ncbi:hypothetical protein RB195_004466 [Necator americanus]|uniref:DNA 3'-5' helicase n=1 Tax=Necator americanus TaxID=51031 RepID=A0ABR1BM60_NECAM